MQSVYTGEGKTQFGRNFLNIWLEIYLEVTHWVVLYRLSIYS